MIGGTGLLLAELVALFLGVAFLVDLGQRWLGPDRLRAWMGGRPITAALKGIAVGFVTPFCTYSAIPLLVGLRRAGVPPAGYVAFIVAAPVLDPVLFGALVLIAGPGVGLAYLAIAFSAALTLAFAAQLLDVERHMKPLEAQQPASVGARRSLPACPGDDAPIAGDRGVAGDCGAASSEPWRGLRAEAAAAARAAAALFRSFGPLVLAGVAVGLAIEAFVSPTAAARIAAVPGTIGIPLAAAVGTPLYFSTELFVPIADSLREAGLGTGPIVALTMAGTGANLPELVVLTRLVRAPALVVFFVYVFAVAVLGGATAAVISM